MAGDVRALDLSSAPSNAGWNLGVSPDGRTLAMGTLVGDNGVLVLYDTATQTSRILEWPADDPKILTEPQQLSFSDDGSHILFVNGHDTDGTDAFDAFEVPVTATSLGEARLVGSDLWSAAYGPEGGIAAVLYDGETGNVVGYLEGGPDVGLPALPEAQYFVRAGAVLLAPETASEDVWFRLDVAQDQWVEITLGSN